ncbi:hypothetical protein [Burkholderia multivorans]|uniref:hypothetical protein n=1 Tax=Burkholderia multivorans TaxID=87883 RepID=UPI0020186510|nr:hypothetical protein [Burkholderia multivorans]MCL4627486.1 hypothetical protein [Burkholderia multivorans]MCO1391017.1 hypothetical protein [Burkholderia multivorans]UQO14881.1 hypothetical protein L0Z40_20160 [Burkholderia multivorans]UQO53492.1 hypothetical protein L0Z30_06530 [Burkholderia multivorans]UQO61984.1 hypothetical protein L0Z29_22105 [Burkholderia multivorans]
MSNIDTEKMKALAAELRANHEAMKSWMPTHQLESSPASKGADAIDTLLDECALLRSRVNALSDLVDSLLAARRACASEFPPDAEGEPDEGRIHENIRKLKAALEAAAAFIQDVSKQKPERPDYWSSCSQCEHNIDRAQDLLEKQAALSQRQEES